MKPQLYGVFVTINGSARWGMTRNKRQAVKLARTHQGEVRATGLYTFDGGDQYGIDAPTFRVLSDQIADFRGTE
jgi:hypothetical protein